MEKVPLEGAQAEHGGKRLEGEETVGERSTRKVCNSQAGTGVKELRTAVEVQDRSFRNQVLCEGEENTR